MSYNTLIAFEISENTPWRNERRKRAQLHLQTPGINRNGNKDTVTPTVPEMLTDIVRFFKQYEKIKEQYNFSDTKKEMITSFITHTNKEENIGTQDIGTTRYVLDNPNNRDCSLENKETYNLYEAILHIEKLTKKDLNDNGKDMGLLDVEDCIQETHKILMKNLLPKTKIGNFSTERRMTKHPEGVHEFPFFETSEHVNDAVMRIIDSYNPLITNIKSEKNLYLRTEKLFKCSAWLLHSLLATHPFCDGNGRLSRLLASYSLQIFTPFQSPIYNIYGPSTRNDYMEALKQADTGSPPSHLATLLLESNWFAWKKFNELIKMENPSQNQINTLSGN